MSTAVGSLMIHGCILLLGIATAQTRPIPPAAQPTEPVANVILQPPAAADAPSSQQSPADGSAVAEVTTTPAIDTSNPIAMLKQNATLRLQQLAADAERPAEEKEALTKIYQQILVDTGLAEQAQNARTTWTQRATQAPAALEVARANKSKPTENTDPKALLFLSLEEGQSRAQRLTAELATATAEKTTLREQITKREKRRKELPQLVSDTKAKLEQLTQTPPPADLLDPLQQEAAGWAKQAATLALDEQIAALESEQRTYEAEAALLPLQLELAQANEKRLQDELTIVSVELSRIQQDQILNERSKLYDLAKALPPELKADGEKTLQRIESWLKLASKQAEVKQDIEGSKTILDRWKNLRAQMDSRVNPKAGSADASGFNSFVGLMLRKQRTELPDSNKLESSIRYYQTEMQYADSLLFDLEDALFQTKAELEALGPKPLLDAVVNAQSPSEQALEQQGSDELDPARKERNDPASELLVRTKKVLEDMKLDVDAYLADLYQVADLKHQTQTLAEDYRNLIDQQVLWIRSSDPLQISDSKSLTDAFRWLVDYRNWIKLIQILWSDARYAPWWYAGFALGMTVLLSNQSRLRRSIGQFGAKAEKKNCTALSLTVRAMVCTLLISLPLPIFFLFGYWRLSEGTSGSAAEDIGFCKAIGNALLIAALVFTPMELLRQVCRLDGLGIKHFEWAKDIARTLATNLRWLIDLSTPLVMIIAIFSSYGDQRWEASLGRVAFIVVMPLLSVFFFNALSPKTGIVSGYLAENQDGWLDRLRYVWYPATVIGPLALMLVSSSGYHYTAMRIATHLNETLWSAVLLVLAYYTAKRWIVLSRRKLMLIQARQRLADAAKREAGREAQPANLIPSEQPELTLAAINDQTKRILTSAAVTAGFVSVYLIWSEILPAVTFLDNFELWSVPGVLPDESVRITLANLVLAIPIVVLIFVAGRNVPGLLEIAFLQHLPLSGAARYAITTLTRYAIVGLGIVFTASTLGLKWASIQWLVAALGLGLGFGLQEIFANFVSGIILLFEQPIRVGDVITVDGVTGSVQRIRMRATTITNWDRQELIIPNKDLITGKLLNWTLTDSTNRIVLNVGVAYGSDTNQACELIREICAEHQNILKTPVPIVTFEGFGDNTLNIVVRAFLATLEFRLLTIHELHQKIYTSFGQAGIEIAFPQRDIHIRSLPAQLHGWLDNGTNPQRDAPINSPENRP